jgi:L-threonylcarbamoyladenylate synthase
MINQEVHKAFEIIKEGGIILYPTDTVWGIGCDATNPEAVAKMYTLKQRRITEFYF